MRRWAQVAVLALVLSGCGSSHHAPPPARGAHAVADCLDGRAFLVSAGRRSVSGQSPGGVELTLQLFASHAAAVRAARALAPATTRVVGSGVVDWSGNPAAYVGAPPARLKASELGTIRRCLATLRAPAAR